MVFAIKKRIISIVISIINNLIKSIFVIPHGICRYYPSCSLYAHESIQKLPIHKAIFKIILRIFRCNIFFKGGYDPVER